MNTPSNRHTHPQSCNTSCGFYFNILRTRRTVINWYIGPIAAVAVFSSLLVSVCEISVFWDPFSAEWHTHFLCLYFSVSVALSETLSPSLFLVEFHDQTNAPSHRHTRPQSCLLSCGFYLNVLRTNRTVINWWIGTIAVVAVFSSLLACVCEMLVVWDFFSSVWHTQHRHRHTCMHAHTHIWLPWLLHSQWSDHW